MASLLAFGPSSPEFGKLKAVAETVMHQKDWSAPSLVALGGVLAAEANRLSGLSGAQKKQLVVDVIKAVFQEAIKKSTDVSGSSLASPEVIQSLTFVIDSVLPASLDLAVAAARGQLDLKKVKRSVFVGCLTGLPSLFALCGVSRSQSQAIVAQVEQAAVKIDPSLAESDKPTPAPEAPQETSEQKETPPQNNSPEEALVIRVPEETPASETQTA